MRKALQQRLQLIEDALAAAWPMQPDAAWLFEQAGSALPAPAADWQSLAAPVFSLLQLGGKRWRPLAMVLSCEACGGSMLAAAALSPLVELPHTGSLIVDDIEDASPLRRGRPAAHTVFGLDFAINSANCAYFSATSLISQSSLPPETQLRLYDIWARGMRSVHLGQGLDIAWHNRACIPSLEEYQSMCRLKTGALAAMAGALGAAAAGAALLRQEALWAVWLEIGLAFQMLDDAVNLMAGMPGKMRGDDLAEGKKGLPVILFAQSQRQESAKLLDLLARAQAKDQEALQDALALLNRFGAPQNAADMGKKRLAQAVASLKALELQEPALGYILAFIDQTFVKMAG